MLLDYILDLIYPNVCGFCNNISKESLCSNCEEKINNKLLYSIDNYDNDNTKYFSKHLYLFKYDDIRGKILDYKFKDKSYLYKTFSKIIIKNEKICGFFEKDCDIIMPVPIHKKRMNERGYNQSELIAKEIAKKIENITFIKNIIIKISNTKPQSTLNKVERIENAKNAYIIKNSEKIKDKKILLLDDIYTTGSTVNECSKLLKFAGAKEVNILTLAKD